MTKTNNYDIKDGHYLKMSLLREGGSTPMIKDLSEIEAAVYMTVDNLSISQPTTRVQLIAEIAQSSLVQKAMKRLDQSETHRLIGEALDQGVREHEWPLTVMVSVGLRKMGLPSPWKFHTEDQAKHYSLMLLVYYAFRSIAPKKRAGMMRFDDLIGLLAAQQHITVLFTDKPSELRRRVEQALDHLQRLGCIRYVRVFVPLPTPVFS